MRCRVYCFLGSLGSGCRGARVVAQVKSVSPDMLARVVGRLPFRLLPSRLCIAEAAGGKERDGEG